MLRESDQDQAAGQRGGKTKTGEKVGIVTDVLAKARCFEDNKHAGE